MTKQTKVDIGAVPFWNKEKNNWQTKIDEIEEELRYLNEEGNIGTQIRRDRLEAKLQAWTEAQKLHEEDLKEELNYWEEVERLYGSDYAEEIAIVFHNKIVERIKELKEKLK